MDDSSIEEEWVKKTIWESPICIILKGESKMSLESMDKYILISYLLFWFSYIFFFWLIRKQYPLLYCAWNPINHLIAFFYYLILSMQIINGYLFEMMSPGSFRVILITHLIMNAILICLLILKHKQVQRAPRFEFRKLTQQDLESMLTAVERFMKEKLSDIRKHCEFEIGYKNFYFFYEIQNEPFLYIEYNQANKLVEVNLEFYPSKEFDLISIHHLMKMLYQSYGKNILAPYKNSRPRYLIIALISMVIIMFSSLVINLNATFHNYSVATQYIFFNCLFAIPLTFLFLDVLRKPDKSNFLNNEF